MPGQIVYRSDNLEVRHVPAPDSRRHVVTFDAWHAEPGFSRPGFGEEFLQREGVAATHVLTHDNDWYQYPDLEAALAAVRGTTVDATRVMTYGLSMGGYAAIRFAGRVGAHAALALSPQYSVDPRKMPSETRWGQVQRRIRFLEDVDGRVSCPIEPVIVYDPKSPDHLHIERFRADTPLIEIKAPYAGHPVSTYVQAAGLLKALVRSVLDGTLDPRAMERELWRRRRSTALYLSLLAKAQPPWRKRVAAVLARAASDKDPNDLSFYLLAQRLRELGDYAGAVEAHERSLSFNRHVNLVWDFAITLLAAGDFERALAHAVEAEEMFPNSTDIAHLIAQILMAKGDVGAALNRAERLVATDPRNRSYRKLLRKYRLASWQQCLKRYVFAGS